MRKFTLWPTYVRIVEVPTACEQHTTYVKLVWTEFVSTQDCSIFVVLFIFCVTSIRLDAANWSFNIPSTTTSHQYRIDLKCEGRRVTGPATPLIQSVIVPMLWHWQSGYFMKKRLTRMTKHRHSFQSNRQVSSYIFTKSITLITKNLYLCWGC